MPDGWSRCAPRPTCSRARRILTRGASLLRCRGSVRGPRSDGRSSRKSLTYRVRAPADAPVTAIRPLVDGRPIAVAADSATTARGLVVTAANDVDLSIDV